MDAQEVLRRVKFDAQKYGEEAKEMADNLRQPGNKRFSEGRCDAFQHIVELIESLEGNRWEKKAKDLLARLPGDWHFGAVRLMALTLEEAYEEGYERGQEQGGRRSADR